MLPWKEILPRRKINGDVVIEHLNTRQLWVWVVMCRAQTLTSLVERHNWFSNQSVEIPRRSIFVYFLSLSAKASLNLPPFEISCSWQPSQVRIPPSPTPFYCTEAGVLVRKLSHLTPLSSAHQAQWNQLWVRRLCTPAYRGLQVNDSRVRPNQNLVSYTLFGFSISLKLPPLYSYSRLSPNI